MRKDIRIKLPTSRDKQEKRRLQLANRPAEGEVKAKVLNMNKRVTAFFVALVMLLALIPTSILIHVKASSEDMLEPVEMWCRVNGVDNWDKVTVEPGLIADNIGAVEVDNLPDGAEFVKALIIDHDTNIETEIKSLGAIDGDTYYSLNGDTNAGTKLESNEELILVYGNRYRIKDTKTGNGKYTIVAHEDEDGLYLWAKEDLEIKAIEPDADYSVEPISYKSGSSNGTVDAESGTATIPYTKIKGDISVNITFTHNDEYNITQGNIAQGDICQDRGTKNQSTSDTQAVNPVTPGDTASFLVFSQSWTGGDAWVLNQLTLNGKDLVLPTTDGLNSLANETWDENGIDGYSATTDLGNGSTATVTLVGKGVGLYWKTGDYSSSWFSTDKKRCVYKVTIDNVHEDYVVSGNFKDSTSREVIIKGLEGIEQTGAALEDLKLLSGFSVMQRYYTFTSSDSNIYTANYTNFLGEETYPSDNLILYTVKYGYNPYSVTTQMSYDGGNTFVDDVRDFDTVGHPVDIIAQAATKDSDDAEGGRYDTSFRHWGKNAILKNKESTYRPSLLSGSKDLLLTTISKDSDNDWYAVAINQSSELNQQLFLNAKPYNYKLNLDVQGNVDNADGISFLDSDNRFDANGSTYIEKTGHTVVDSQPYTYLPAEPTKDGYLFEYWQLLDADGNVLENTKKQKTHYEALDQFELTEENVALVMGDVTETEQAIKFVAVWSEITESSKATVEINAYTQVSKTTSGATQNGSKYYANYYHDTEIQNVGKIALLNMHTPEKADYYVLNEDLSNLTTTVKQQDDISVIPEDNKLSLYYDYKTVSLDLQKIVKGKPKSTEYNIKLTLKKDSASPVSIEEAVEMMGLTVDGTEVKTTEGSIVIEKTYGKNSKIEFANVPYNWTYEVFETESTIENDFTSQYEHEGTLDDNTKLIVTNTGDNPGIETEKALTKNEDGTYNIDLAAYATGESYTEQLDANVPLDIALVLDQSGSMMKSDVYKYDYVQSGGVNKTSWTINDAVGKYIKVGTNYYPVEQYTTTGYKIKYNAGSLLPEGFPNVPSSLKIQIGNNYYTLDYYHLANDGKLYQIQMMRDGYLTSTGNCNHSYWKGGYHLWLYYTDASGKTQYIKTADGDDHADSTTLSFATNYYFGSDIYEEVTFYGLRYYDKAKGKYVNLTEPSHTTATDINDNTKYLYDSYTATSTSSNATFVDSNGKINTNGQTLFTRTAITRVQALKNAVNGFVEKVAEQSKENNIDHRVAIIGFANNEQPSRSTTEDNIVGSSEFVTTNTGIFVNGTFKNYITPNLTSSGLGNPIKTSTGATVTKSDAADSSGNYYLYSNLTYFVPKNNEYLPLRYFTGDYNSSYTYQGFNRLDRTSDKTYSWTYDGSTRYTSEKYYSEYVNSTNGFYYPSVTKLSSQDYKDALETVQTGGVINDNISSAIDQVNAYGGTYLPYGLAMANKVFANNEAVTEDGKDRKRVVIVFTDGEPGGNGYDQTIANESLTAANISKDTYGASVYTIGLYPESADEAVTTFMHQLSSEYFTSTENVYEEKSGITSSGNYYFNDEDGRTHALTKYRKSSEIKFEEQTVGNRTIPVTYDSGGKHTQTSWYDSDGWVRAAYWDKEEASNPTRSNFYQFFTVGDAKQVDGNTGYYYSASDSFDLAEAFETISTQLQHPTTTVKLDAYNSFMKDGLSQYFDRDENTTVELTTYDASESDINTISAISADTTHEDRIAAIKKLSKSSTSADGAESSWEDNYLSVTGFDYSTNYIGDDKKGKILVATIKNAKLKEGVTGTNLPSNTDDSGVYVKNDDNSRMVAEFNKPTTDVNAFSAKVKLQYIDESGKNKNAEGQKFNVTFKLTKSDGTPYTGKIGNITYSSKGEFSTTMKSGDEKEITDIPKDAILTVTVSDPDNANTYYTYAITDNVYDPDTGEVIYDDDGTTPKRGSITGEETAVGQVVIKQNHPDILISVTDNRQVLTVTNHTQKAADQDSDFSDKTKEFPIKLSLYKGETKVNSDVSFIDESGESIEFKNGEYTAKLADGESIVLFVPDGYTVKVEDDGSLFNYSTKYKLDDGEQQDASVSAVFNKDNHTVDVYHYVNSVVISGIMDGAKKVPALVWIASACAVAAGAYVYIRRRRKLMK